MVHGVGKVRGGTVAALLANSSRSCVTDIIDICYMGVRKSPYFSATYEFLIEIAFRVL